MKTHPVIVRLKNSPTQINFITVEEEVTLNDERLIEEVVKQDCRIVSAEHIVEVQCFCEACQTRYIVERALVFSTIATFCRKYPPNEIDLAIREILKKDNNNELFLEDAKNGGNILQATLNTIVVALDAFASHYEASTTLDKEV